MSGGVLTGVWAAVAAAIGSGGGSYGGSARWSAGWSAGGSAVAPAVVAVGWALLVVVVCVRRGPDPARVRALRAAVAAGGPRRGAAGVPAAIALAVVLAAVAPALALAVPVVAWSVPRVRERRVAARAKASVDADLPEVVDLLRMCVGAGLTVPLAVEAVARGADGPVARALAVAVADARDRGRRLADALEDVPARIDAPSRLRRPGAVEHPHGPQRHPDRAGSEHGRRRTPGGDRGGESVRGLVGVLVGCERYGHAIGPALERLAAECRADERRRAEAAARRVPVLLLFPLVTCILPAFALLTVAPLIAGALDALRLS